MLPEATVLELLESKARTDSKDPPRLVHRLVPPYHLQRLTMDLVHGPCRSTSTSGGNVSFILHAYFPRSARQTANTAFANTA